MKYINISEPVKVSITKNDGEVEEINLYPLALYEYLSDSDDEFNRDLKGAKSSMRIDIEIRKAKAEKLKILTLEDEDWKRLTKAAQEPSAGYPIRPAKRIKPFIDALIEASDSPPAVMEAKESQTESDTN